MALKNCRKNSEEKSLSYSTMIVLTSGNLSDLKETKNLLTFASSLSFSLFLISFDPSPSNRDNLKHLVNDSSFDRQMVTYFEVFPDGSNIDLLSKKLLKIQSEQIVDYSLMKNIIPNLKKDSDCPFI